MKQARSDHGFALPAAVFALVIVGVLVTGGFFLARQETRIGVASQQASRAFYVAEQAANDLMANWDAAYASLPAWEDTVVASDTMTWGYADLSVTRLSSTMFFIESEGTVTEGGELLSGANRRVAMLARVRTAVIDPPAALTTQGELQVGGSAQIFGQDSIPGDWGTEYCDDASLDDKPGILIDDSTNIDTSGNRFEVEGDPPIEQDTTITSESLLEFGDLSWEDLVALAQITYPSSETLTNMEPDSIFDGGSYRCDTSMNSNWGDPENPGAVCFDYFPIIYGQQDLNINSSAAGQGILLVEGDLAVQGGFTFYGPVIVKGELSTAGTGGHFNGGVIAANVNLDQSTVLGNAVVSYSSCSVTRAILNNSALTQARPVAMRSWVDVSSVVN